MPQLRYQVMISSTWLDLKEYREALVETIRALGMDPIGMETHKLPDADVIDISYEFVDKADIVVGLIGIRYGSRPVCPERNPGNLSISELEFDRALAKGKVLHYFRVGDEVTFARGLLDKIIGEGEAGKHRLERFVAKVENKRPPAKFDSIRELQRDATHGLQTSKEKLDSRLSQKFTGRPSGSTIGDVFERSSQTVNLECLNSPYIMSQAFVGRSSEIATINDWARSPGGALLVHAIGGMGKSALTWHWAQDCAARARPDWAGLLWYSFYEQGATLRDFLIQTVAFINNAAPDSYREKSSRELCVTLRQRLDQQPWLLVLDGLERVLVAYNRPDKASLSDEEAEAARDALTLNRQGLDCARPDDDHILATLAQSRQGKLLASSRLVPSALLPPDALKPIHQVTIVPLKGMAPADAAQLLVNAGISGDRSQMESYLQQTFDCHPLVVRVIPGLIMNLIKRIDPLSAKRGEYRFDRWVEHAEGGKTPELTTRSLVGRKGHILEVALDLLEPDDAALLANLAMVSCDLTDERIRRLNPKRPPQPPPAAEPKRKDERTLYLTTNEAAIDQAYRTLNQAADKESTAQARAFLAEQIEADFQRQQQAHQAVLDWPATAQQADEWLGPALERLSKNGLIHLQHDTVDLHPVIRHTTIARLDPAGRKAASDRIVNAFEAPAIDVFGTFRTMNDLDEPIARLRALCDGGQLVTAADFYTSGLGSTLLRLGAWTDVLELARYWFNQDWNKPIDGIEPGTVAILLNHLSIALGQIGQHKAELGVQMRSVLLELEQDTAANLATSISNLSVTYSTLDRHFYAAQSLELATRLATAAGETELQAFCALRSCVATLRSGDVALAGALLADMPVPDEDWLFVHQYRAFSTALWLRLARLQDRFDTNVAAARLSAVAAENEPVYTMFALCEIARWQQEHGAHAAAELSYNEAIRMARQMNSADAPGLAIERARSVIAQGKTEDWSRVITEALLLEAPPHVALAELYRDLDQPDAALEHAGQGYRRAWADGPPYHDHWALQRCRILFQALGAAESQLPVFDAARHPPLEFAEAVEALIVKLDRQRREREAAEEQARTLRAWKAAATPVDEMPPPPQYQPAFTPEERAAVRAQLAAPGDWCAPPGVPGRWAEPEPAPAAELVALASGWLDQAGLARQIAFVHRISRVRACALACYPGAQLVEMQGTAADGRPGIIALLIHGDGILLFDGTSPPLHALNAKTPPALATAEGRASYMQLFMNKVCGEAGRFQPVDGKAALQSRLADGADASPWADLLLGMQDLGPTDAGDGHHFTGTLLYGNDLFKADLVLRDTGMVEMLNDEPIATGLPVRRETYVGPLLITEDVSDWSAADSAP